MELHNIILFTIAGFTLSYARYGKPRSGYDVMQLHARIWKGLCCCFSSICFSTWSVVHLGYPHCLMCSFSFIWSSCSLKILLFLSSNVCTTPILWWRGWWELNDRHWFVWVFFLCTSNLMDLTGLRTISMCIQEWNSAFLLLFKRELDAEVGSTWFRWSVGLGCIFLHYFQDVVNIALI